jgi:hypothetical protein
MERPRYRKYIFSDLIRFVVCQFLAPSELLLITLIDSEWLCTSRIDSLWLRHVPQLWANKTYNNPHHAAGKTLTLHDRIKDVSMANLRKALIQCDTGRCVEKADWRSMLVAKLLFGRLPHILAPPTKYNLLFYPEWALKMPKGKSTYFHARKEAKRDYILKSELVNIKWKFQFKQAQDEAGNIFSTENLPEGTVRGYYSFFFDDYSMISESHQQMMQWTMNTVGHVGEPGASVSIQVESFPVLTFSRLEDNRWRMENLYVYFTQPKLGDEIPTSYVEARTAAEAGVAFSLGTTSTNPMTAVPTYEVPLL